MTNKELIFGNTLIAIYSGVEYELTEYDLPNKGIWHFDYLCSNNHQELDNMNVQYSVSCEFDMLQYHSNWNWLMPVLKKLENDCPTKYWSGIIESLKTLDVFVVFQKVVECLKECDLVKNTSLVALVNFQIEIK